MSRLTKLAIRLSLSEEELVKTGLAILSHDKIVLSQVGNNLLDALERKIPLDMNDLEALM